MTPATVTRLGGLAVTAAIAAVTVLPATALGASGSTTLKLDGPAAKSLRAQGVKVTPLKPASGGPRRVVLPVAAGLAGESTTLLSQRGGIRLQAPDGRSLRLTELSLVLGKGSRVKAKLGGSSINLFRVLRGGRRAIDPLAGSVTLGRLRLALTSAAAAAISTRLGLESLRPERFGTLAANVTGLAASGPAPSGPAAKEAAGCPLPSGAGPAPEEPLPLATKPAGAVDVSSATIDWHVRESFIRYIATGEGTSVSGGASADPPQQLPGTSAALSYGFHFPFAAGWLDPGANPTSPADDGALLRFGGAIRFLYSGHGIDLTAAEPEIEIAGAKSRAIFSITDNGKAAGRQVLINLDLSRAAAVRASGHDYIYERVPGAIPAGTATSTFAGFYSPGTDFGCVTVSFTTAG